MWISVFSDLALYLAVGGRALSSDMSGGAFLLFFISCFKHVWHRFLDCLSLESSCSLSPSQARLVEICNIEQPGDCTAVCSRSGINHILDLAVSHRLDHLYLPWHLWSHDSFLRNRDHPLKLFVITLTRSFQGVRIPPGTPPM